MWITQQILTRSIAWLAAIAISLQGVPLSACGCSSSAVASLSSCCGGTDAVAEADCCGVSGALESQESLCCSSESTLSRDCSCSAGCQCGEDCQCGEKSETPAAPTTPPEESNSPERVLADAVETASYTVTEFLAETRQRPVSSTGIFPPTALDNCVVLCRFIL